MRMSAVPKLQISYFAFFSAGAVERSWEATEFRHDWIFLHDDPAGISRVPKSLFIVNAVPEDGLVFNYENARFFQ